MPFQTIGNRLIWVDEGSPYSQSSDDGFWQTFGSQISSQEVPRPVQSVAPQADKWVILWRDGSTPTLAKGYEGCPTKEAAIVDSIINMKSQRSQTLRVINARMNDLESYKKTIASLEKLKNEIRS